VQKAVESTSWAFPISKMIKYSELQYSEVLPVYVIRSNTLG